ncbi:hypothetical protein [Pseudoxanthomonas mexicana]|uniref:hypothetical protein n=1 Tax=Pseudoxanthomonas mexicana TaxID=128785 RepID=UPI00398A61A1
MASQASRYLFLFLLGLAVGGICTVMAMRALQARQDPFPDSVMHVMDKHAELLSRSISHSRCAATDTVPHVRTLRAMANDLEIAFPGLAEDQRFSQHASQFRASLDAGLSTPPTECVAATQLKDRIRDGCKACHQDFRG